MKILILAKRHYTNKDLINDKFGRLYHIPLHWSKSCDIKYIVADYRSTQSKTTKSEEFTFESIGVKPIPLGILLRLGAIEKEARTYAPDIIFASGDPIIGFIAHHLSKKLNTQWVFDVYDDYRHFPLFKYSGLSVLLPYLCSRASKVITVSENLKNIIEKWNKNVHIAENGYDPKLFTPKNPSAIQQKNKNIEITYTGSVDSRFDIDLIIQSFNKLKEKYPNITLVHAGAKIGGERLDKYSWYKYKGNIHQEEAAKLIQQSFICIAPYAKTNLSASCNPCKLSEYMASNIPVLCSNINGLLQFKDFGVTFYEASNLTSFVNAMKKLIEKPEKTSANPYYEWSSIAESSLEFIQEK